MHHLNTLVVKRFEEKPKKLFCILLVSTLEDKISQVTKQKRWITHPHAGESRKLSYGIIDELGGEWFAVLLKFFILQPPPELIYGNCRINRLVFTHKHNPGGNISKCLSDFASYFPITYIASINGVSLLKLCAAFLLT